MAAIVSNDSRCGLRIEVHHSNQSNKSLALYIIQLFHFNSQLHICNRMECFSYKGGCGVMHI